jgi:hypothetical protein
LIGADWSSTVMIFPFVRIVSTGGCCAPIRIEAPMTATSTIETRRMTAASRITSAPIDAEGQ